MSMTDNTQVSESWVKNQIRTSQNEATDAIMTAVADVISAEPKTCEKAEEDIAMLRQELAALKIEVAELRGTGPLMVVRAAWSNWKRHLHGSRLRADGRTRAATWR
jgi:hypothetical protein